jgi:hypothetical protein
MSNSFQFDYNLFYKYYTTESNLEKGNPHLINYYPQTNSKMPIQKNSSNKFIRIDNKEIYIKRHGQKEKMGLLFTLPTEEKNITEIWDNHFHFGIDHNIRTVNPITKKKEIITGVYFHKTLQHPEKGGGKELISCFFLPKMEINRDMKNFKELKCLQRGEKMNQLYTERDFIYLNEIIQRPFREPFVNNTKKFGKGGTKKKKVHRHRRKSVRCLHK